MNACVQTLRQEERRGRVSEIMESDVGNTRLHETRLERLCEIAWLTWCPDARREDETVLAPA